MKEYYLSTHVETFDKLKSLDIGLFDVIFLGDPTCPSYPGNIMVNTDRIMRARDYVKRIREDVEVVLSTFAVPRNKDLDWQIKILDKVYKEVDAVEAHNMGVIRYLGRELKCSNIVAGFFANIYTHKALEVLNDFGVKRAFLNPELSMEEIFYIKENSPVDIFVFTYGKLPLGISESCFIKENKDSVCENICEPMVIESGKWRLVNIGFATFSGKDWNIFEYLGVFYLKGFKYFYIQGLREKVEDLNRVAYIFKGAIEDFKDGKEDFLTPERLRELESLSKYGFCNGYLFRRAGHRYIGRFFGGEEVEIPSIWKGGGYHEEG